MKQNKNILRAALLLLLVIAAPEVRAQQLITANADGTYTIIMPDHNVTVTADVKKLLTHKDISVTIPSQEWTGSELTPVITVTDGTTTLNEGTDYTVTAPSGTIQNAGNYTYTITGAGNYSDETTATFTITPKPVTVNNGSSDVPAATGDATITQDQNGTTLTLITPDENEEPQTVNIPTRIEVDHVEIERTFTSEKASTVYLPFSIDVSKVSGGKFHKFTSVDETKDPWVVTYDEITTGKIEANTPYIFLPDDKNSGKIVVSNSTDKISVCTASPQTTHDAGNKWEFIGTYAPITWSSGDTDLGKVYGFAAEDKTANGKNIAAGQFVKVAAGASIAPMRAYLKRTPSSSVARMRGATDELPETMNVVLISADGEATTIGTITLSYDTDEWYSLDGRKLSGKPTKKGLYIRNGKKIVVK